MGLSDEIRYLPLGFRRGREDAVFLRYGKCLDHPSDISPECAHDLHAFLVAQDFLRGVAVDHGPVLTGGEGHAADDEILLQLIKGGCCAGAARADDAGADLAAQRPAAGVEHAVHERGNGAAGGSVMNRGADNQRIAGGHFVKRFVYAVIHKDTAAIVLAAAAAADASADGTVADPEDFGFNALGIEGFFDLAQSGIGAASLIRTAVDQ